MKARRDVQGLIKAMRYKSDDIVKDKEVAGRIRRDAANALGELGDNRAVEPLIAALTRNSRLYPDREMNARSAAAQALGQIGDSRALKSLIAALDNWYWIVRHAAAEALLSMYHNASLLEKAKQEILACRSKITSPHTDDWESCGGHTDNKGIGVEFPL